MKICSSIILFLSLLFANTSVFAENDHGIDLEFDNQEYLSIADSAQSGLDINSDLSFEAWIRIEAEPGSSPAAWPTIIGKTKGGGSADRAYGWYIQDHAVRGKFVALEIHSSNTGNTAHEWTWEWSTGVWYHLAVTYDLSAGTAKLYIDGTQHGSDSTGGATSIRNGSQDFKIGRLTDTDSGGYWNGVLDEVRVWSDIRTADEIQDNLYSELLGTEANLIGYWQLENNADDLSSNGNDLTENNGIRYTTNTPFE